MAEPKNEPDKADEKPSPEAAGDPPQAAETVTLPAQTWARVRELAELGQQVEAGQYRPAAEVEAALKEVEKLRDGLVELMRQRTPAPVAEQQAGASMPMLGWATALRQARPGRR